jgi:hypothetical protein
VRPVAALRVYVAAVRALLSAPGDESVRFDGEQFRYRVPPFRGTMARPAPPVWIDAAGPARVTAHEQALADLLTAGTRPGLGPEASSPPRA